MSDNLRIVFLGTPDFAVASLDKLVRNGCQLVGVITSPDKPAGRGQKMHESAVKRYASQHGLKVLQPKNLKGETFLNELKELKADLQVIVAFRMLPEAVWNMPRLGTFNLHASLLPQYRGAAPINWAIMNGEKETGVTTFFLKHEIDTGDIISQDKIRIGEEDNAEIIHDKLMIIGAELVLETVKAIASGNVVQQEQSSFQNKDELKSASKIFKADCEIDWDKQINELYDFIRGLSPYPAAWTTLNHKGTGQTKMLKVFASIKEIAEHKETIGTIETDAGSYCKIAVDGGYLSIKELQLEGKKKMAIEEFLRGFDINEYHIKLR